ncbi:MAG: Serine/threonine-protein phosphatase 2A activator 2 [Peltula sp. TS41687]|nr:MAG: Serine/threonine-protein phosphatase 2A activator 2 [Peltula sp. TS41687]
MNAPNTTNSSSSSMSTTPPTPPPPAATPSIPASAQTRAPPNPNRNPNAPPPLSSLIPKLTAPRRRIPSSSQKNSKNPLPIPTAPPLPPAPARSTPTTSFSHPTRRILSAQDHALFLASPTYDLLLAFVFSLTDAVRDTPVSAVKGDDELSPTVRAVLAVLDAVEEQVVRCPPEDQGGSRFGNPAFRRFLDALGERGGRWMRDVGVGVGAGGEEEEGGGEGEVDEVATYFLEAFGNRTRIDYGSGHELNFVVWLLCLYQLRLLHASDFRAVVLRIFARYMTLMRVIQSTYYLEPAGSHGVWGLDDYQFLPFLFGASQLLHHPYIRPLSIHQALILEQHGPDYLYLGQVAFVNSIKNVDGLRWHSPMLDDISAAKSWEKVEAGMRRMFVAEVLKKLPVMQHFLFGSLIPAVEGMGGEGDEREAGTGVMGRGEGEDGDGETRVVVMQDGMKHVHLNNSWGDCCGIKVPSSIGAAEEMKKRMGGGAQRLRRVPFD